MRPQTICCVGDFHFPFAKMEAVNRVLSWIGQNKPKYVIQLGDLYDFYSFTSFDRSYNLMTPQMEWNEGRKLAEEFWRQVKLRSKASVCYQLLGNHDIRVQKKMLKRCPELAHLLDFEKLHSFIGVRTIADVREELILRTFGYPIVFQHGYLTKEGQHLSKNRECTVIAHTHRPWVHYSNMLDKDRTLWEMNAGFLGDSSTLPFSYTKQRKIDKTILSFGVIDRNGPKVITL